MNVPFVIIYQHEHQQITGKIWEKKFKIKNLGFPDNKIESKIETYLKNIQNETILEKKNFKNVVDGKGVFRVAKEIKNLLNN